MENRKLINYDGIEQPIGLWEHLGQKEMACRLDSLQILFDISLKVDFDVAAFDRTKHALCP